MDNGKTWTDHNVYFKYGKVHSELMTLPNGDILLTYATRIGEPEGRVYHGIEAVLSHDHGKSWDWDHRFILFRWPVDEGMAYPISVRLSDGRILTMFIHHHMTYWGWQEKRIGPKYTGYTTAVIWELF